MSLLLLKILSLAQNPVSYKKPECRSWPLDYHKRMHSVLGSRSKRGGARRAPTKDVIINYEPLSWRKRKLIFFEPTVNCLGVPKSPGHFHLDWVYYWKALSKYLWDLLWMAWQFRHLVQVFLQEQELFHFSPIFDDWNLQKTMTMGHILWVWCPWTQLFEPTLSDNLKIVKLQLLSTGFSKARHLYHSQDLFSTRK